MPRTIHEGFTDFHRRITPSRFESGKATSHKSSIERRLERDFDLRRLFYSGSANNGTSISRYSDADFFASIPTNKLKEDSSTTLRQIRESLDDRFPSTRVYVDSPAVVIDFGSDDWDRAEVIPADYIEQISGSNTYDIPNGSGGWMRSGPTAHTSYVSEHHNRLSKKLRPLIRFLKAWKYNCNVPVTSFYLELRATKLMASETSIVYSIDLCSIFQYMDKIQLTSIQDPMGISGYIRPCKSEAQLREALSKLQTARIRAEKAREAERDDNVRSAFDWWDKVFAGQFPGYYR